MPVNEGVRRLNSVHRDPTCPCATPSDPALPPPILPTSNTIYILRPSDGQQTACSFNQTAFSSPDLGTAPFHEPTVHPRPQLPATTMCSTQCIPACAHCVPPPLTSNAPGLLRRNPTGVAEYSERRFASPGRTEVRNALHGTILCQSTSRCVWNGCSNHRYCRTSAASLPVPTHRSPVPSESCPRANGQLASRKRPDFHFRAFVSALCLAALQTNVALPDCPDTRLILEPMQ